MSGGEEAAEIAGCNDADEALRRGLGLVVPTLSAGSIVKQLAKLAGGTEPIMKVRTLSHWLKEGLPTASRVNTELARDELVRLIRTKSPAWAERLRVLSDARWQSDEPPAQRQRAQGTLVATDFPREWWGVIPRQEGRAYASIDQVVIQKVVGEAVEGEMIRLSPPDEQGYRWTFSGTYDGPEAFFLSFTPRSAENSRSRGVIAICRPNYRQNRYSGFYERQPDDRQGLIRREYSWHRDAPPMDAVHDVALFDLDNTLRPGWMVDAWLDFLSHREGWGEAAGRALETIRGHLRSYEAGQMDHDELVRRCEEAYAAALAGRLRTEVLNLVAIFLNAPTRLALHEYVMPMLDLLRKRWISPVIVSGAPREIVEAIAERHHLETPFGLDLRVDGEGVYDGTVVANPGLSGGKDAVVAMLQDQGREVVLAVGDSTSDKPLWDGSPLSIVVGASPRKAWMPSDALLLDPADGSWTKVRTRLLQKLPRSPQERMVTHG